MATYPFTCTACGREQDHIISMGHYMSGYRPNCESCDGALKRMIVPFNEVGTGNRMHHIIDHTLCPGASPTVFNTRSDWEAAMKRHGVRPMEEGDAKAQMENEGRRIKECREKYIQTLDQKVDRAIDRALQEKGGL